MVETDASREGEECEEEGPGGWFPPPARRRLAVLGAILLLAVAGGWWTMIRMPGSSHEGPLPELTTEQDALARSLREDVETLASAIGSRHVGRPEALGRAADRIADEFAAVGLEVSRPSYRVDPVEVENVVAEVPGDERASEVVVCGAHYDTIPTTPGANDNGSGVAAVLHLARALAGSEPARTLRLVAFVNEEPPFFQTDRMGSRVYARSCAEAGDDVVAMLSLETIGHYSDEPGSQSYPFPAGWVYPDRGNFIAFVGNVSSRKLVHRCVGLFRDHAAFPSQGAALPGFMPGVGWSDHWAFWQEGYPAIMVTDTAIFRYPHYHAPGDTPDRLDYERMARVVEGLEDVVLGLCDPSDGS